MHVNEVKALADRILEGAYTSDFAVALERAAAFCRVVASGRAERAERGFMHPGRVDVIGAGALLWSTVLERVAEVAGVTEAWASEHDILDGIVLSLRS